MAVANNCPESTVRIIGGQWRGSKIIVPAVSKVRPTPNRVRETVFNWLAPYVVGAFCLDAFAGSGALGFEALSRGAAAVTFIDIEQKVIAQLRRTAAKLRAAEVTILQAQFPRQFSSKTPFDIVFLDPPFNQHLIAHSVRHLQTQCLLKEHALVYTERTVTAQHHDVLPSDWQQLKHKQAGEVAYGLYCVTNS